MKKPFLIFLLAMLSMGSAKAQFSGGSGTEDDPYLISCEDDLYDISTNLSAHYKMTCDLDLTEWIQDESPKMGWEPMGTELKPFTGSFDGNEKTISGVYINRPSADYVGLFGYVQGATFKNLTLESPNVTGRNYSGALFGFGRSVTLENLLFNKPTVSGNSYIGIIGANLNGDVSNIIITTPSAMGGSYVGSLAGTLSDTQCQNVKISDANVSSSGDYAGICVGYLSNSASITTSDVLIENAQINGKDGVGGVCGLYSSAATISNKTVISNVEIRNIDITGSTYVGGVVGRFYGNSGSSSITENVSNITILNGNVYGNNYSGGMIGYVHTVAAAYQTVNVSVDINNCYVNCNVKSETGFATGLAYANNTSCVIKNSFPYYSTVRVSATKCTVEGSITCTNGDACGMIYIKPFTYNTFIINESTTTQCIFKGSVFGKNVNGISYAWDGQSVCFADILSATSSLYRIGTGPYFNNTNYAYNQTSLLLNGEDIEVEDNDVNGIAKSARLLKRKNTYIAEEMGYDFVNDWAIVADKTLPYLIGQSTPPEITTIADGKVTGTVLNENKSGVNGKVYVFVDQTMYKGVVTDGAWEVNVASLEADTEVKVSVETEGKKPSIIVKATVNEPSVTPGNYETITLTSTYATYCPTVSVDFTDQTNIKAYAATGYEDGMVVLTRVYVVPVGEGVLLKGNAGTYQVGHTDKGSYYTNLLKGVTTATNISPTSGDKTNFILANGSKGIGFYPVSETGYLAAGKAYLQLPTTLFNNSGRKVIMAFDDETTGIGGAEWKDGEDDGAIYNLQGIKANNLQKGIYVKNKKKFVIK